MLNNQITLSVTQAFIDFLREHQITYDVMLGKKIRFCNGCQLERNATIIEASYLPNIGMFTHVKGQLHPSIATIGRFCTIGHNLTIEEGLPVYHTLSTSPLLTEATTDFTQATVTNKRTPTTKPITIGHDVWIGNNVTLRQGVDIATGAIIAPNAVVTSDVKPYQIVEGNPAKPIGSRFSTQIIERLLQTQWWLYPSYYLSHTDTAIVETILTKYDQRPKQHSEQLTWEYGTQNKIPSNNSYFVDTDEIPFVKLTSDLIQSFTK
jgi:acetyltransferase-like isoleucine patch superfamily enzyme